MGTLRLSFLGIWVLLSASSCSVLMMSMTPTQVHETLPTLTESTYMTIQEGDSAQEAGICSYLVRDREYYAPVGVTPKNDLKNGAIGIDEWVALDGGNAYALKGFEWQSYDEGTQLVVVFHTMKCR